MTPLALYQRTVLQLDEAGIAEPQAEARLLLCHLLGCRPVDIFLARTTEVTPSVMAQLDALLSRRLLREPLAYLLGETEFFGRPFDVGPDVLIPRPETELLVEKALSRLAGHPGRPRVLDMGTGSGCIAVTLALECPAAMVVALDRSLPALGVARRNAARHGVADRIGWLNSDWASSLAGQGGFSLVAANPPYVAEHLADTLQAELAAEPSLALYGGEDGCRDIDHLMADVPRLLCPGGTLLMEIGFDQEGFVLSRMAAIGRYDQITVHRDYAGLPRILEARRRPD